MIRLMEPVPFHGRSHNQGLHVNTLEYLFEKTGVRFQTQLLGLRHTGSMSLTTIMLMKKRLQGVSMTE
jgi:hypothetical protein